MLSARKRLRSRAGQSLSEYVLLLGLVAVGLVVILLGFRGSVGTIYTAARDGLAWAASASAGSNGAGGGSSSGSGAAGGGGSTVGGTPGSTSGGGGSTVGSGGSSSGGGSGGSDPTPGIQPVPQTQQ
jgi:Flp pilus assembly pilin Flp